MNPLNHVAIIMDGNGRWGLKHKNSRNAGHKAGLNTVEKIIKETIKHKIKFLKTIGIKHNNIIIDPGIGFGKNLKHNMNLISNISIFHSLGFPILVGNSRKRFIKEIVGKNDTNSRIGGTVASSIYLMMQGVQILRIHDVNELLQGVKVFKEIIKN